MMIDKISPSFTENSRRIFDLRYPRKDDEGLPAETPEETVMRVASNVASVTALYADYGEPDEEGQGADVEEFPFRTAKRQYDWLARQGGPRSDYRFDLVMADGEMDYAHIRDVYYDLIASWRFVPNSPTWTGSGTPLGQLAACFVLPIDDDLGKESPDSIMDVLRKAALIQQTGGGNGFGFSRLRPTGAVVKASMGRASGPVGFLTMYDAVFGQIAQGGSRRGANMAVLRVDHPDILQFVECKTVEGEIANFNISVALTEEFMTAVEKEESFDLRWRNEVFDTVDAKELFGQIVEAAWKLGDPGCLFIDRANAANPNPHRYDLEATNPCGEQWLGPYENCCLGQVNLSSFADWDQPYDWEGLAHTVALGVEFLDDVVDANQYVPQVPELEEAAQGARRIGLGVMGLADAMVKLGISYGSERGQAFVSQVMEFVRFHTMDASIQRAIERGPFPWIKGSIYDPDLLDSVGFGAEYSVGNKVAVTWEAPVAIVAHQNHDFGRPAIDWDLIRDTLRQNGIRNAAQNTIAPTGTTSNVAALEGSGCEPIFALVYIRKVMQEGENIELPYLSALFDEAMAREGYDVDYRLRVARLVQENGGSCQGIEEVPEHLQEIFVVAGDLSPQAHIWMQGAAQAFVDNAISKTINFPKDATVQDVADAYLLANDIGCKGVTIYRQGSRELEVLSVSEVKDPTGKITEWPLLSPIAIPDYAADVGLSARVYPVETFFGKVQVTITELDAHPGRPFDVRLQLGKGGNDKNADVEAIGRSISIALRTGTHVKWLVEQLEGIGGLSNIGFGDRRVLSVADGVAKLLKRVYIDSDGLGDQKPQVDLSRVCPKCTNTSLVMQEGCFHCDTRLGGCGEYEGCD
jgi:ribonucleoside-diphosphate reductase alpha chain